MNRVILFLFILLTIIGCSQSQNIAQTEIQTANTTETEAETIAEFHPNVDNENVAEFHPSFDEEENVIEKPQKRKKIDVPITTRFIPPNADFSVSVADKFGPFVLASKDATAIEAQIIQETYAEKRRKKFDQSNWVNKDFLLYPGEHPVCYGELSQNPDNPKEFEFLNNNPGNTNTVRYWNMEFPILMFENILDAYIEFEYSGILERATISQEETVLSDDPGPLLVNLEKQGEEWIHIITIIGSGQILRCKPTVKPIFSLIDY